MGLECRFTKFLKNHPEIKRVGTLFTVKRSASKVRLSRKITPNICRIIGIIHGDGNMSGKRIHVTDKNREYHQYLQKLFMKTFNIRMNLFYDEKKNTYYSHSKNSIVYKYLVEFLELPKGSVRQNLKIPSFLNELPMNLQAEYVAGIFDSESHIRKRQAEIGFTTTSKDVWVFLKKFFKKAEIKFSERIRRRRKNPEFEIFIYGKKYLKKFNKIIRLNHNHKIMILKLFLSH